MALNEVYAHAVLGTDIHVVRYFSAWAEGGHMLIQNEFCNGKFQRRFSIQFIWHKTNIFLSKGKPTLPTMLSYKLQSRKLKGGVGSLFDPCVSAMSSGHIARHV